MATTATSTRRRRRRCPSCRRWNESGKKFCRWCYEPLARKKPFRMTAERVKAIHALAARKGLDDEIYHERLRSWTGKEHCTQLKRDEFERFMQGLKALPDRR